MKQKNISLLFAKKVILKVLFTEITVPVLGMFQNLTKE